MVEPVFKGRGLSLQAALVMDSLLGSRTEIDDNKVQSFHPDDRNTMLITAVYYMREDVARVMLENGANLAARNFEACRFACSKMLDFPKDKRAKTVLGLVAQYAQIQGVDLEAIRREVTEQRAAVAAKNGESPPAERKRGKSSRVMRQEAKAKNKPLGY